jgi:hypothetical protein
MKNNKINILVIAICVLSFAINSCCKKKPGTTSSSQILTISIPYSDTGNLPAIAALPVDFPIADDNTLFTYLIPTYADSLFKQNGSSPEKVISVKAKSLILSTYSAGQNLDFVKDLRILISDKDGANKVLLGQKNPVPLGSTNIDMVLSDQEMKRYIIADTFKLTLAGTIRAGVGIPAGSALNFTAKFEALANP